ncbi:unnamed protein product [Closterium sp. Naga37s-1]|nr:unnamed protein product [Closterium sp. Naga37s-1]
MSLSAAISMSHKEQVQRWGVNHALPQQCGSSGSSVTSHDGGGAGGGGGGATSGQMFPTSYHLDARYSPTQVHGGGAEDGGAGWIGSGAGAGGARSGASAIALRSLHGRRTSSGMIRMTGLGGGGGGGGGGGYGGFSTPGSPDNLLFPPHSALPLSAGTSPDHPHFGGAAAGGGIGRSHLAGGVVARSHSLLRTSNNGAGPTRSESKDDLTLLMDARARNKLGAQGDWSQSGSRSPDSLAFSASARGNGSGSLQALMDFRPYNGAASAAGADGNAAAVNGAGNMQRLGGGKGAFSGALSMDLGSDLAGVSLTESDCVPVGEVLHSSCVGNTAVAAATARGGEGTGEGEDEEEPSLVPCLNWEAVEALCLDMELDRRHIEAIHILHTAPPAPASHASQAGAGAGGVAGAATGAAGGAVPWCPGVDPPVVYALQFAGADEWYWPGCGGLLGGSAAATVA